MLSRLRVRARAEIILFGDVVAVRVIRLLAQELANSDLALIARLDTIEGLLRSRREHS